MTSKTLTERVKALASRANGMHSSDIPDEGANRVGVAANNLVRRGELFRVVFHHRHVRFYTDRAIAEATIERVLARERTKPEIKLQDLGHAPWTVNDPAIVPDHVKVQYCESFTPRFVECVAPFVHGFRYA